MRSHTGEKGHLSCNVCGKDFNWKTSLVEHMRMHSGEKPHTCKDCGMAFARQRTMALHQRIHTGEKRYVCDICDLSFTQTGTLKRHKLVHTGERPHKCSECGAGFTASDRLAVHMRVHTGERPYSCNTCGESFKQSGYLKIHSRIHNGERPYSCDVCLATFSQSSQMIQHKRTHTGIRPFACDEPECDATFLRSGALTRHKECVHSVDGAQRRKLKEDALRKELELHGVTFVREYRVDFGVFDDARRFARIDFCIERENGYIMLEMDEYQHDMYPVACEMKRMQLTFAALSLQGDKPAAFVRFNPDACSVDGNKLQMPKKKRVEALLELLDTWSFEDVPRFSITYMYYDHVDGTLDLLSEVCQDADLMQFYKDHTISVVP